MSGAHVPAQYTLFPTSLGVCGLAWNERGVVAVQLPEGNARDTEAKLKSRVPGATKARTGTTPADVEATSRAIAAQLAGTPQDLSPVRLDDAALPPFHRKVYAAARRIGHGTTASYGELAALAGSPGAQRAVGQAMAKNPFPVVVPCHRVLASGTKVGGFTAFGGARTKERMLAREGVVLDAIPLPFDAAEAVRGICAADPKLGAFIAKKGPFGLHLRPTASTFDALAEAIVYQQLNGKAAATIHARVRALFPGRRGLRADDVLAASTATLRSAGLSEGKTKSLKDLAARAVRGEVPTLKALAKMDDDDVVAALVPVRAIGRWTVEMLLIFRLGRPDVLPVDDYGVRKGFQVVYGKKEMPTPKALAAFGERWRPWRTVASWYFWRALDPAPAA